MVPRSPLLCTFYVFSCHSFAQDVPSRPLEPDANFSFELTGDRGAALVTKYSTYSEDSLLDSAFERYTERHHESWVAFAHQQGFGSDIKPVLVSGVDMTRDFEMVAYSYEHISLESDLTAAGPIFIPISPSFLGTWRTRHPPNTNRGPQECIPPPPQQAMDTPPLQLTEGRIAPSTFNQCVFVRYYTMRGALGSWLFRRVFRVGGVQHYLGAGPHGLGPGDNLGDIFQALVVQSDAEMTDDFNGVERDTIVRNMIDKIRG